MYISVYDSPNRLDGWSEFVKTIGTNIQNEEICTHGTQGYSKLVVNQGGGDYLTDSLCPSPPLDWPTVIYNIGTEILFECKMVMFGLFFGRTEL